MKVVHDLPMISYINFRKGGMNMSCQRSRCCTAWVSIYTVALLTYRSFQQCEGAIHIDWLWPEPLWLAGRKDSTMATGSHDRPSSLNAFNALKALKPNGLVLRFSLGRLTALAGHQFSRCHAATLPFSHVQTRIGTRCMSMLPCSYVASRAHRRGQQRMLMEHLGGESVKGRSN